MRLFQRKNRTLSLANLAGWIGWGNWASGDVTPISSLDTTAVFCAARVIAEGIAQMPVRVVREDGNEAASVVSDHWAHRLLSVRPNSWQTGFEFREGMIFSAALAGGAIAVKNVVRGEVKELLPVPPGSWTVEQDSDWNLRVRVFYADKTSGTFSLDQVCYLRGPSLDGYTGIPAVRAAREAIGLSKALEVQQARLAGNGGKPSGVLSFPAGLGPEARARLEQNWKAQFGRGGEGGVAILDKEAKFTSMTMTSVDAQYLETRRLQIEEIARAFRVQPIMLMQADKAATFASAEQMFRNHVIHTLGPWIERFESVMTRDILGNETGLRIDLDERNLLRGDFKDQAEYFTKALGAGGTPAWMTQNEVRAEVGLPPIDGGDVLSSGAMNMGDGNGNQVSEP